MAFDHQLRVSAFFILDSGSKYHQHINNYFKGLHYLFCNMMTQYNRKKNISNFQINRFMLWVIICTITEFHLDIVTGYHLNNRERPRTVKSTVHTPIARKFIECRCPRDGALIISNIGGNWIHCIGYL